MDNFKKIITIEQLLYITNEIETFTNPKKLSTINQCVIDIKSKELESYFYTIEFNHHKEMERIKKGFEYIKDTKDIKTKIKALKQIEKIAYRTCNIIDPRDKIISAVLMFNSEIERIRDEKSSC